MQGQRLAAGCGNFFFYIHLFEVELGLRFYIAENYCFFGDKSWKTESCRPKNVIYRSVTASLVSYAIKFDFFEDKQNEV